MQSHDFSYSVPVGSDMRRVEFVLARRQTNQEELLPAPGVSVNNQLLVECKTSNILFTGDQLQNDNMVLCALSPDVSAKRSDIK